VITGFPGDYFRPTQLVTRAEYAAMVQKAFDSYPANYPAQKFSDVPPDYWAAPAIDRAVKIGFLKGYPKNVFLPEQRIPRVQALVSLATGLGLDKGTDSTPALKTYKDAQQIPNYARNTIGAATQAGLAVGHPDPHLLKPGIATSRADIAVMIYQALVKSGKAKPIQSQYIVPSSS
jgi:hypothetical protein